MDIVKFQDILVNFKKVTYNKDNIVRNEQDFCDDIGIVISGMLKISTFTTNEKEETITLLKSGDMFGNNLIFSSNPYYLGNIITLRKTEIILIKKQELLALFNKYPLFLEAYLKEICDNALQIKQQNKLLAHKSIQDRLMYYLSTLSKQQKSKNITIPKITEISLLLSIPRPSISRELKNLEDLGYIKRDLHHIKLK